MAVLATDNFNRSDRSLDTDTSSGGQTWALGGGSGCSISSNVVIGDANSSSEYISDVADTADCFSELDIVGTQLAQFGPMIRHPASAAFTGYLARCNDGGAGTVQVVEMSSGSASVLGTSAGSSISINDTLRIYASGTSIAAYVNAGLVAGPYTDSTHTTGKGGIGVVVSSSRTGDNFNYESLAAGGISIPVVMHHRKMIGAS